ncbi:4374_t:CDS:2, partial [Racocetra persica]
ELTLFQRAIILTLVENECSQHQVAWTIRISPSTVSKIVKKFKETGKIDDLPRSGHPKIFSSDEEKLICEMIIPGQYETAVDVHAKFCCETNKEIELVERTLNSVGYINILNDCLLDMLESYEYDEDEMIFQHDNARIHMSIATKA